MGKGGTQTFVVGEGEEQSVVTIEEIAPMSRVADDTYRVKWTTSSWEAGFHILVHDNEIMRAYSPFHSTLRGIIYSAELVQNSKIKATYTFIHKFTILTLNTGVVATITADELKVTKL